MGRGDQTRILAVVLAGFILRLWRLGGESLSTDEGRTWTAATSSLPRMIELAATRDGSPPLFHLLTSLVLRLVDDESGLRLVSVLASTGLIVLTYRLARLATDRRGATVAAAVTALSPFQLMFAQEARAHATVAFFTVLSLYLFARAALLGHARAWRPCVVATVLGLYTHGLALLGMAVQALALAFSRAARLRVLTWVLAMGAVFVAYLPWLVMSVGLPSDLGGGTLRPPSRSNSLPPGQVVLLLAVAVPLLASLLRLRDPGDRGRIARFALIALVLPLAVVMAATFRTPQWQPGHLVLLTPMLGVLVALGLETLRPRALAIAWTALLLLACGHADFRYFVDFTRERWRDVAERVAANSDPDSTAVIVVLDSDAFEFYNTRLVKPFRMVSYTHPDVSFHDAWTREQYGAMYRRSVDATVGASDVWVISRSASTPARKKAALMAENVASFGRYKIMRDTLDSSQGELRYSHWRDRVDGATMRRSVVEGLAYAESVMANPPPPAAPITTPFTAAELAADRDSVAFYIRRLGDRGFIEISEHDGAQRTWYTAAERLGSMGASAIPALMERLEAGDDDERMLAVYALLLATQDPRVMARTGGDYVSPGAVLEGSNVDHGVLVARAWWGRHGHFWSAVPSRTGISAPAPPASFDTLRPAPRR